ncbi:MAG: hypothetical protein R2690_02920 [Acidimicrobiales bacterium]
MPSDEQTQVRSPADEAHGPPVPFSSWAVELVRLLGGLAAAYTPGSGGIDARTREQMIVAMSDLSGRPMTAWVHASWLDFLGDRAADEVLAPLFDYAEACAVAGRPLDTTTLDAVYPPLLVASGATVARTVLVHEAEDAGRRVIDPRPRPGGVRRRLRDGAVMAVAAPFAIPVLATATAMRVASLFAPPLPPIELPEDDDANLVVHLLAEATPAYLAHALVRTGIVASPFTVAVGVRMEGSTATLRLGRGRVTIDEGIHPDVLVVLQGEPNRCCASWPRPSPASSAGRGLRRRR